MSVNVEEPKHYVVLYRGSMNEFTTEMSPKEFLTYALSFSKVFCDTGEESSIAVWQKSGDGRNWIPLHGNDQEQIMLFPFPRHDTLATAAMRRNYMELAGNVCSCYKRWCKELKKHQRAKNNGKISPNALERIDICKKRIDIINGVVSAFPEEKLQTVFDAKIIKGFGDDKIARYINVSRPTVQRYWSEARRVLGKRILDSVSQETLYEWFEESDIEFRINSLKLTR